MNYNSLAKLVIAPLYRINTSEITRTAARNRTVMLLATSKKGNVNAAKRASGQLGSLLYHNGVPRPVITQIRCRLEDALMGREMGL